MTRRSFIACDTCNSLGIRIPDQRRTGERNFREGRRHTDGRAWFDGTDEEAGEQGWWKKSDGKHVCPDCRRRRLDEKLDE